MKIINNKAVLLRVKNPDKITTIIPKSKLVSVKPKYSEVLVNYGLEEMVVLRNIGIKNAPSPIMHRYDWPGLYKPFAHQKITSAFLTMYRRAFCFNEQGTAKTASVIWAADFLMNIGQVNRVLIVCPLSIMECAWLNDLFKTAMHRSAIIAHSHSSARRKDIFNSSTAEFVITNYEGVEVLENEISRTDFDLIVIDEAGGYKNSRSKRWATMNKLLKPSTRLWMLTGTPAAQSPVDAYGLAKLVNPDSIPKFYGAFRDLVMYKITNFRWVPKPTAKDTLHSILQPAIRFTKEECLDLPPMTYITRDVPLTSQQSKYYETLRKHFLVQAAGEDITAVNAAASLNKLLQISSGSVYTDKKEVLEFDISSRYKVLKEVLEESSNKVIVFVPYRHSILRLHEMLVEDGYGAETIHGGVNVTKRSEIFKRFEQGDDIKVLIIQPRAASHGVTLVAADTIVYWGPVLSVETYLQCNARIDRPGQKNKTTVIHLQGSNAEKKVYAMLRNNITEHEKLIDLYKEVIA